MFFLYYSTSSTSIDINADFYNTGETKHEKKRKKKKDGDGSAGYIFCFFFVLFFFLSFIFSEVKKLIICTRWEWEKIN